MAIIRSSFATFRTGLGSQSYTVSYDGTTEEGEVRYKPWGGDRYTSGTMPTSFRFTGQRNEMEGIGLYFFQARWYDPYLNRHHSWPLDLARHCCAR